MTSKMRMATPIVALFTVLCFMILSHTTTDVFAQEEEENYVGIVTKIVDGDTIHIDGKAIRLSFADTPEKRDIGFEKANRYTETICPVNSYALVDLDDMQEQNRFGKQFAKITCSDDVNLNASLLESGNAVLIQSFCMKSEFMYEEWTGCDNEIDNHIKSSSKKINDNDNNDVSKTILEITAKMQNDTTANVSPHTDELDGNDEVQENDDGFLIFIFLFAVLSLIIACCCIIYIKKLSASANKDSNTFVYLE